MGVLVLGKSKHIIDTYADFCLTFPRDVKKDQAWPGQSACDRSQPREVDASLPQTAHNSIFFSTFLFSKISQKKKKKKKKGLI